MEKIKGRVISDGIGMGILKDIYKSFSIEKLVEKRLNILAECYIQEEIDIYQKARLEVKNYYISVSKRDEQAVDIFEGLSLLATDEELAESIINSIKENLFTAEYAVYSASRNYMKMLDEVDDEYIRQRSRDIEEVADKIILQIISIKDNINIDNVDKKALNDDMSHILIVDKLLPEMLIGDNADNISGVVTHICADNSHAAIIARTKNIPVLTAINVDTLKDGDYAIIDDKDDILIINPDENIRNYYEGLLKENEDNRSALNKYKNIVAKTKAGKQINIHANVSSIDDIKNAIDNGTNGIGLFRTELFYMDREMPPTEDEQFSIYKEAAVLMKNKPLVIRTFDGGLDKPLKFMEAKDVTLRGIQLSLRYDEIFKTQLRAIYRAAVYGNIKVMFPMIASENEVARIMELLTEVKAELASDKVPFEDIQVGIMIETPLAVEFCYELTKDIDFVSIGTNDLIYYSFNRDRIKENGTKITDEEYDRLFNMIKDTVDSAHKNNCKVSVCGELASDLNYTDKLLELGVDELSVAPSKILLLRKQINC